MIKKQFGYTIVEIFIALAIGLVLFAGVLSIFVGMKTTSEQTTDYGELQENGRFALAMIADDLRRQDFFGDYAGTLTQGNFLPLPAAPGIDCTGGGLNNQTLPGGVGHFRTLWGTTVANANVIDCINDANVNSDLLQLKRVMSIPVAQADMNANNYYLESNVNGGRFFIGPSAPLIDNSQSWEYQHHIYYVSNRGANNIPVLMQGRLTNQMTFVPLVDGIEMIRFMYGVDTDEDGIVNEFLSATNMPDVYWNRGGTSRIIAVKVYVLARSIYSDPKYTNTSVYLLGDYTKPATNDGFRRLLFSTTVKLANAQEDSWR